MPNSYLNVVRENEYWLSPMIESCNKEQNLQAEETISSLHQKRENWREMDWRGGDRPWSAGQVSLATTNPNGTSLSPLPPRELLGVPGR